MGENVKVAMTFVKNTRDMFSFVHILLQNNFLHNINKYKKITKLFCTKVYNINYVVFVIT